MVGLWLLDYGIHLDTMIKTEGLHTEGKFCVSG